MDMYQSFSKKTSTSIILDDNCSYILRSSVGSLVGYNRKHLMKLVDSERTVLALIRKL